MCTHNPCFKRQQENISQKCVCFTINRSVLHLRPSENYSDHLCVIVILVKIKFNKVVIGRC